MKETILKLRSQVELLHRVNDILNKYPDIYSIAYEGEIEYDFDAIENLDGTFYDGYGLHGDFILMTKIFVDGLPKVKTYKFIVGHGFLLMSSPDHKAATEERESELPAWLLREELTAMFDLVVIEVKNSNENVKLLRRDIRKTLAELKEILPK